mgnify:CR=1 FL=1|jgi:hypothetical protein
MSGICIGNDSHYALGVHFETETESKRDKSGYDGFWDTNQNHPHPIALRTTVFSGDIILC